MASRCRACGLFIPAAEPHLPFPAKLIPMEPHLAALTDAAAEFDKFGQGNAVEFVRWLSVDVIHAAGTTYTRRKAVAR